MVSLIICTYQRPESLANLLNSIEGCTVKPSNILIIDASPDTRTKNLVNDIYLTEIAIDYYQVPNEHRGLTRQRNYGIAQLNSETEIVTFLDDDIRVEPDYFRELIRTYSVNPDAIGVGGIDLQSNKYFQKKTGSIYNTFSYYELDGWVVKEPHRYKARKLLGLLNDLQPGLIPDYSHGRSALPPSGRIYEVEHFMGGIASYRMELLRKVKFSNFFEGYGLYEDFDFCVRALKFGKLYVNTNAKVWHYHEPSGRPDFYKYGKMVVKNGWYVWRVRHPSPSLNAKLKWHAISVILANIRLISAIAGPDRKNALMDYLGRMIAWIGINLKPPVIQNHQ